MKRISNAKRAERLAEALSREKSAGKTGWWWLSFADDTGFLGVCIVQAVGFVHAMREAHRLGINPGGEVQATQIDKPSAEEIAAANRLLNRKEALKLAKLNRENA